MPSNFKFVTLLRLSHSSAIASIRFFPDRLAMLANLCDHEYRINTEVLELPGGSFPICCLTLAIIYGDLSLLVGYREEEERLQNKDGRPAWFVGLAENR